MKNTFLRILLSLLFGGALNELLHITTGDPNRPEEFNFSIVFALFFYVFLSIYIKKRA